MYLRMTSPSIQVRGQKWRDDMRSWRLGERELKALARCLEGESFVFKMRLKKHEGEHTIFALCGHVNHGPDYHLVCRGCQLLSYGALCCSNQIRLCGVGKSLLLVEKAYVLKVAQSRKQWMRGITHRGNYVTIEVCGASSAQRVSVSAHCFRGWRRSGLPQCACRVSGTPASAASPQRRSQYS